MGQGKIKTLKTSQNSMNTQHSQTYGTQKKNNVRKKIHITIVYIKNFEKNLTSDTSAHLKALEQKKTNVYRRNR